MIADRSFDRHNQLTDPFTNLPAARPTASPARAILVNGAFMPHHEVGACRYRLRILNVSQFRSYNLQLSNGAPMVQIGSDSGLMPKPVRRREILIGPAERVEVIVDFAGDGGGERSSCAAATPRRPQPGRRPHLRRRADAVPGRPRPRCRPDARSPAGCGRCRPGPSRRRSGATQARQALGDHRSAASSRPPGGSTAGPSTPPAPKPSRSSDTTEVWEIFNRTDVAHVMHLHHNDWYLLEPRRQAAAALGRLSQGDLLRLPRRTNSPRRALLRLPRQVRRSTATCSTTRTTA